MEPLGSSADAPQRLVILLPALHEAQLVSETLSYFRTLPVPEVLDVNIVVITSPEEADITTRAALDAWRTHAPEVHVDNLHDVASTSKQMKLQAAVATLRGFGKLSERDWIGVFDFDARPDPETLLEFARTATHCDVEVVQQVPLVVPCRASSLFGKLIALDHLRRVLLIETWLHQFCRADDDGGRVLLRGCMGASLFVRVSALDRAGGFPAESDDIALGYRFDVIGARRAFLRRVARVQTVRSGGDFLRQYTRIFRGVLSIDAAYDALVPGATWRRRWRSKCVVYATDFYASVVFAGIFASLVMSLATGAVEIATVIGASYATSELIIAIAVLGAARQLVGLGDVGPAAVATFVATAPFFRAARELSSLAYYCMNGRRVAQGSFSTPRETTGEDH